MNASLIRILFKCQRTHIGFKKMKETFDTTHHAEEISQQQLLALLVEAVIVRDSPGMADVDSSLLWFCREIKKRFYCRVIR